MESDALVFQDVHASYGDSRVLRGVSLRLRQGRLLALLGRNGAGKTTCIKVAMGLLPPRGGSISLFGESSGERVPEALVAKGISLVPQGRRLFRSLTVRENLVVAVRAPRSKAHAVWTLEAVYAAFPRLRERQKHFAGHLSGGEQQMLAVGRALMSNPRILLMDEPSEGLAPQIVAELMTIIRRLRDQGLSIILVEQNPKLALEVADDVAVITTGRVVVDAPAKTLNMQSDEFQKHLGIF